jgi:phage terminase large subunit
LSTLKILTAKIYEPLLQPARYKGAHGGRGSGKSHFFGELLVETCQAERGTLAVCIREAQRTLAQSSKRLIESKIAALGVGNGFKLYSDKIETPGDGIIIFRGMQSYTFKAAITVIVTGFVGAVWLGIQGNAWKIVRPCKPWADGGIDRRVVRQMCRPRTEIVGFRWANVQNPGGECARRGHRGYAPRPSQADILWRRARSEIRSRALVARS